MQLPQYVRSVISWYNNSRTPQYTIIVHC